MSDEQTRVAIERLRGQYERLAADAESEKETRRRRNQSFDQVLHKLNKKIYGNGEEGITTRLERMESQIKKIDHLYDVMVGPEGMMVRFDRIDKKMSSKKEFSFFVWPLVFAGLSFLVSLVTLLIYINRI